MTSIDLYDNTLTDWVFIPLKIQKSFKKILIISQKLELLIELEKKIFYKKCLITKKENQKKYSEKFEKIKNKINKLRDRRTKTLKKISSVITYNIDNFREEANDLKLVLPNKIVPDRACVIKTKISKEREKLSEQNFLCCNKSAFGNMILCEGIQCKINWYHYECAGITSTPKTSFYCSFCSSKNNMKN